jgi:hypothetical protein
VWEETRLPNDPCEPSRLIALEWPLRPDFIDGVAIGVEWACFRFVVLFRFVDLVEVLFYGGQPRNQEAWSRSSGGFQPSRVPLAWRASSRRSHGRLLIYAEHLNISYVNKWITFFALA